MPQTTKEKAIQASLKRRFKKGDTVSWLTSREGSVEDSYLATGKVTEIRNLKSSKLHDQSNQIVSVEINDKGRKVTGKLGTEAHSNQFIKQSNTVGKSFVSIKNKFLVDAVNLRRKKIAS